ncbi:lysostaphin resistance A-like protein [Enterococcus cecorum]|uniref:Lysostaphin resistance A-like protein n=1 Tax=Enterococcus cecorum TaxID=44008 RepID=A0AAW9JYJ7_9ENTE|nr:CPBP family intramembrane glutamic endopeptidase [Enterococcus cecorum]MCJ0572018.1 lysostaphin resistance A-like protein [Enterococcus cecorum]MCJ0577643.1 lysostaphin resistance A-like protein [Enterococcus cecorum]MCJ0583036.1 lysostaphin resistance A-like protein [Enterococcus cecorum]MCJ0584893.1 lysostaphin resistance A-like protein [Enterococcus cecorum]MCJ0590005.1 lysostaphin resistance A-like protein [Enterococcus cecorum]
MENIKNPIIRYLLAILLFIGLLTLDQTSTMLIALGPTISSNQTFVYMIATLLLLTTVGISYYLARKQGWMKPITQTITKDNWKFILSMFALTYLLKLLSGVILQLFGVNVAPENQQAIESLMKQIPTWYMGLMILVLAPMVEEFICRALIFKTIKNKKIAFVVAMLVFALLHVSGQFDLSFIVYLSMSATLTYTYYRHENLNESIAVHFLNNLIGFVALLVM